MAWQDDELPPEQAAAIAEHLSSCAPCRAREAALAAVTPEHALVIPPRVRDQLATAVEAALDSVEPEPAPALRADEDVIRLRFPLALGYVALLLLCLGWGLSNWLQVQRLEDLLSSGSTTTAATVPAHHFRPASWKPSP